MSTDLFEITTVAVQDTYDVKLVDPSGAPIKGKDGNQLSITIYGPGSEPFVKASTARAQRSIDRTVKKGRIKVSAEEMATENAAFLASITISFNGWTYKGANDQKAIKAAYMDRSIGFIRDQVDDACGDWANFTKGSETI